MEFLIHFNHGLLGTLVPSEIERGHLTGFSGTLYTESLSGKT